MPKAEFFSSFGLLVVKDFFDEDLCARLRHAISLGEAAPAMVRGKTGDHVDEAYRRTRRVRVPEPAASLVYTRLLDCKPLVENHFHLRLEGCERPQFLSYKTGDFFRAHEDHSTDPNAPESMRRRRISAVIFLNSQTAEPVDGCYCGGSLTFYGLMKDPRLENYGFPLAGKTGLLVAFPSALVHEVTPVTYGDRATIVSWYF